ncbi:hypothetical protein [Desulfolutivibrio sulfoxidireducens]|uniref:hypothetical protein n=1 Tax=Desulfolutivibrio sulfoxidireducens TaxID=2773299 RepID=UPI00159CF533|nr:hypothetical protein [Desulfolutivibrio sulfoxidireducens]QLA17344.1 hypothetical protein GD605_15240 [Desulfolutivibrio sulfoxidireducens]
MGHIKLGTLPRTRAWQEVVGLITAGADVSQIANATIRAADKAFSFVLNDEGFTEAVWLMVQFAIAAKKDNYNEHLQSAGINLSQDTSLPDLAAAVAEAMDRKIEFNGSRSDLGEMSQRALVGALVEHISPKLPSLFAPEPSNVKAALVSLGKKREFGELSRTFFAKLTNESMNYFLSKTLATHLGEGQRFATMNEMGQFEKALTTHCKEASLIVEQFSADWFSKHKYEEGGDISRESSNGFASYALKKMKDELREGARADAR